MSYFNDFMLAKRYADTQIKNNGCFEGDEGIDKEIRPYIRRINSNPNVYTIESCYGHGSTPVLFIVFRNSTVAARYLPRLVRVGMNVEKDTSDDKVWSIRLPGDWKTVWKNQYSSELLQRFWRTITNILTS